MELNTILRIILDAILAIGGVGGFISIYHAKSNKQTIDIGNFKTMLDEAQDMYVDARKETKELRTEFSEYKRENANYITEFKSRFQRVESRMDKAEKSIMQAYKCPFPKTASECPVLREYDRGECDGCYKKDEN